MASSTRGGKRGSKSKKQQIKLKPTESGAFMYQSPSARKRLKAAKGSDELDKAMFDADIEAIVSGKKGLNSRADIITDRIHDVYFDSPDYSKPRRKAKGGAVRAYANGGAVMSGRGPKFKGSR